MTRAHPGPRKDVLSTSTTEICNSHANCDTEYQLCVSVVTTDHTHSYHRLPVLVKCQACFVCPSPAWHNLRAQLNKQPTTTSLTPWRIVALEKLTVAQLVNKFPVFYENPKVGQSCKKYFVFSPIKYNNISIVH